MSEAVRSKSELEQRGDAFGRELAAALALAGERSGGDRAMLRDMAALAVAEIVKESRWLAESGLPMGLVLDYEHACRHGFEAEFNPALQAMLAMPQVERRAA